MDRKRNRMLCGGSMMMLLLGHMTTALEVPLDPKVLEGLPQPPTIIHQSPKDYIIDPRENIIIHCEAKGKPHPSFSWTRNGTHFDVDKDSKVTMKPNSGTLIIDISGEKAEAYEGIYQCIARNEHGSAVSNNIFIRQSRSPLWSKEKNEPITVQRGMSLVLQCRPPAGLPPPIIFWMDNYFQRLPQNSRVSQALNGDLYFSNVLIDDTRNDYICYARFPHTQTIQQKQPITVNVLDIEAMNHTVLASFLNGSDFWGDSPSGERAPSFMHPPGTHSTSMVLKGDTLELECIADGLPTPDISWSKVNGELPSGRFSFHSFQKTLKITEVTDTDGGDYRCLAKNRLGSNHHVITVVVKAAPFWISSPQNLILAPKETGMLTCRVDGNPRPKVAWSVNGVPIENSPKDPSRKIEDDVIILSDVPTGSSAVYQCNASNEYGYLLANAFVSILAEPPRVLTPPNHVYSVITNSRALLDCASFGSPLPKITWFKDSQSILDGDSYIIHKNGTLEINVAQPLNSGKYTCTVSNNLGNKENHVYLEVKEPTRILKQPEYKVVQRNSIAVFECKVKHDPTLLPTMIWLKDNGELPDDVRFEVGSDSLTIRDVTEDDEGTYTCIRNTTLDQDSASAALTVVQATPIPPVVQEQPDMPTDLELTDQRERSVQLTWTTGDENNSPIKLFLIQYEDSLHEPGIWVNMTEVSGTSTTAHLELSPYVYYSFRVLALNEVGLSEPSTPSRQYRTNPSQPDMNPSNVEAIGTSPDSMTITWKELTGLESNGPGLQYKVSWRQKDVDQDWNSLTLANISQYVVTGTDTFVPYEVTVQAINDYGSGPRPEVVLGYSGEDSPNVAPENIQVSVQNGTEAEVRWEAVPPSTVRGRLKGYKVSYWKLRSLHKQEPEPEKPQVLIFSSNDTEGHLSNLHPYSQYSLNIRAFNGKGDGPTSTDQHFVTPEGVPGPPANFKVRNLDLDSLVVEWAPPLKDNGHLTGYLLKYQPINATDELGPLKELLLFANETSITLDNLKYSTRYKFYLNAMTVKGSGPTITEEAVTVMDEALIRHPAVEAGKGSAPPPPPPTPPVSKSLQPSLHNAPTAGRMFGSVNSSVEEDHALISWEYSGPDKNVYVEYVVDNSKEPWKTEFVNGTRTYQIRGLKPGMSYRVRVVAKDYSGTTVHGTEELLITVPAMTNKQVDIATQGWFIGLMCAIALLILVLLIVCFIKRNKGGKYPVKEKEDAHQDPEIQPMKEDDGTFGEYSDTEDHKPLKGSRTPSNGTVKKDDSDDSLVDYGEGGDGQFNEDGSFIGQYSGKKEKDTAEGNESSEAPSPVNAMNSFV
ncbi:neuronal cell adhesion molecule-like isoform X1 [Xyrauchen texanus]|uniref:neuronal cell adhesion molecule-like isoform X1 n=1 Tax=Xyrauchen texanus TaxID=154827 RepID=UPI0022422A05|nr:neuronal cell adhesion molecule-like isoform X1 [Xyrauchen texanus]XP_051974371.1 neuronal cell adhesion molecule-like isoform X1 [Xyrauchen texanus]XP_051974372.1 neuronal cell adhesion molecule-like isoform X1 [Xyrauchen texanus]XP_051974373.1 neuronal cell adhesion molecule-like isoform X1 [Xyrauchen texanus]